MSITVSTVDEQGVLHSRHSVDEQALTRALLGTPEWITDRPHEGGYHSLATCPPCAARAALTAVRLTRDLPTKSDQRCEYLSTDDRLTRALQEFAYTADPDTLVTVFRKWRDVLVLAKRTPMRRAAPTLTALTAQARCFRTLATLTYGAHTEILSIAYSSAADLLFRRMQEAD